MGRLKFIFVGVALWAASVGPLVAEPEGVEPEASLVRALGGRAIRDGDALKLRIEGGGERIYLNENRCDGEDIDVHHCFGFRLHGYVPEHDLYIIRMQYYEGHNFIMMSGRSGIDEFIGGFPSFSPSMRSFATANSYYGGLESLSVWQMSGSVFIEVWNEKPSCPNGKDVFLDMGMYYWLSETAFAVTYPTEKPDLSADGVQIELTKNSDSLLKETGYRIRGLYLESSDGQISVGLHLPAIYINDPAGSLHWRLASSPEICQ